MNRIFASLILLLLPLKPLHAASGFAGEFLALGAGARALALGEAYVAVADDATAGYWNPAGLALLKDSQLHLTHAERFSGMVAHDYVAFARPGRRLHGLSFGLMRVGVDEIPFTRLQDPGRPLSADNRPVVSSTESSADYAFYLSAGRHLGDRLSLGASIKGIYRTVGSFSAHGLGLDLGLRYRLSTGIAIAAVLRDLTTTSIAWDTDSTDRIRPSLLLGAAYSLQVVGGRATLLVASRTGGDAADAGDERPLNAGVEYWYRHLGLRAGVEEGRQTFGIGLRPHARIDLDLAYLQHDQLEEIYQLSAAFHF